MESLPCYTTQQNLDQGIQSGPDHTCSARPGCGTNAPKSNGQSPVVEMNADGIHREDHTSVCLKCLQLRNVERISSAEDFMNGPISGSDERTNCRRIGDYLETNKDDNYFEEFMLPSKVLSKFALVMGKGVVLILIEVL